MYFFLNPLFINRATSIIRVVRICAFCKKIVSQMKHEEK